MRPTFSPALEREHRTAYIRRLRGASFDAPAWVLCPSEGLRRGIEREVAAGGGAFVRIVNLDELALSLDAHMGLGFARAPSDLERAEPIERCLSDRGITLSGDGAAGTFQAALALLPVLDTLRAHLWDGRAVPLTPPALTPSAAALVASHVELLGDLLQELEAALLASKSLDTMARLRRALAAMQRGDVPMRGILCLDGIDRCDPLLGAVLAALRGRGVEVIVAPWVSGWAAGSERPIELPASAATLLAALDQGAARCSPEEPGASRDQSVVFTQARDPADEASLLAEWIAERCARGDAPGDFAVLVDGASGALDRVRRALRLYDVPAHGQGAVSTRETVPWQVFRAAIRLAWTGVDVFDLTTVLSAPGAGIWGGERDRLCALLRREVPADWHGVRALLVTYATPVAAAADADLAETAARAERVAETCAKVTELVDLWSQEGPFARVVPALRVGGIASVVKHTLARFMNPLRFGDALGDARIQTLWIEATAQIADASLAAVARWERSGQIPSADSPGAWLADVEAMLGVATDDGAPHAEGVRILTDAAHAWPRPRTLVVTGFQRGRFPSPTPASLLLGALERQWLGEATPELARLPSEAERSAVALRDTARALSLPTERLILIAPRRDALGDELEPALAWSDLIALLPSELRAARAPQNAPTLRAWIERSLGPERVTARARRDAALRALTQGQSLQASMLAHDADARDLVAARLAPDRSFAVGDLVRLRLAETTFEPRDLETLLKCRYAFLTGVLLELRPLRLARAQSVSSSERAKVAAAALRRLEAPGALDDPDARRAAIDSAIGAEIPWASAVAQRFVILELRRATEHFLLRYAELRRSLGVVPKPASVTQTDAPDEPWTVELPGERAHAMRVKRGAIRVETSSAEGEHRAVLIDLRSGSTRALRDLRGAGLDVESAIGPMAAERGGGETVTAMVRVSLSRSDREYVPSGKRAGVEGDAGLDAHRERVLASLGAAFGALNSDEAAYPPLDELRATELQRLHALPCNTCAMRLGCRFRMPGL